MTIKATHFTGNVLRLIGICLAMACIGCEPTEKSASQGTAPAEASAGKSGSGPDKVALMLNWYPEAEHGGFYAAKVHGIFEKHGLDVEIRPGGENAPVAQELLTGRVQFGVLNADEVLLFREQGADIVALLAPIQQTPRCILVRAESGIDSLSKLKGLTLQGNDGQAFLSFMKKRGMLEGVQVVPYAGSVAQFVSDKNTAIQAYNFSEPLLRSNKASRLPPCCRRSTSIPSIVLDHHGPGGQGSSRSGQADDGSLSRRLAEIPRSAS